MVMSCDIFVFFLGEEQAAVGEMHNATHCTQQEGSLGPTEKRTSDTECSG